MPSGTPTGGYGACRLGLARGAETARVGDQPALRIDDAQARLLAAAQVGQDALRAARLWLFRREWLAGLVAVSGRAARAPRECGSEQATLLHHRLLLRAQELALVGVEGE